MTTVKTPQKATPEIQRFVVRAADESHRPHLTAGPPFRRSPLGGSHDIAVVIVTSARSNAASPVPPDEFPPIQVLFEGRILRFPTAPRATDRSRCAPTFNASRECSQHERSASVGSAANRTTLKPGYGRVSSTDLVVARRVRQTWPRRPAAPRRPRSVSEPGSGVADGGDVETGPVRNSAATGRANRPKRAWSGRRSRGAAPLP